MTLLERWDNALHLLSDDEIRRALAIAQAVEEIDKRYDGLELFKLVHLRADELLGERK